MVEKVGLSCDKVLSALAGTTEGRNDGVRKPTAKCDVTCQEGALLPCHWEAKPLCLAMCQLCKHKAQDAEYVWLCTACCINISMYICASISTVYRTYYVCLGYGVEPSAYTLMGADTIA